MKVLRASALAALPPSLAALVALQCLSPALAFLAPANRVRCPASAKKWARGDAWDWVDGDEGRFRDGLQNGPPGRERGYYDDPTGPGYERDRLEGGYWDEFEGGPGGYGGRREYYDEPSSYPPEYGEGFDQDPSGNQWSDEQYAGPGGRGPKQFGPEGLREQYEGQRGAYYDEPRYSPERQDYQQQYQGGYPTTRGGGYEEQNGGYQGDGFREDNYYDEPPPQQSYEEENAFDGRPPGGFGARDDWPERDRRQPYDEGPRPFDREQPRRPTPRSRRNGNLQQRDQARRGEIVRGGAPFGAPFGFGSAVPGLMSPFAMLSPFAGFPMMDPFGMMGQIDRQMDQMMQRFGSEMQRGFSEDSIEGVLEDARDYLAADPAAADMLGDDIRLGTPFARSSSAAVVNGMRRSRLQLGIPVSGSRGAGRVRLLADDGRIAQIKLDVEGRTIDIPVGGRRRSNSRKIDEDGVIDADVVAESYY